MTNTGPSCPNGGCAPSVTRSTCFNAGIRPHSPLAIFLPTGRCTGSRSLNSSREREFHCKWLLPHFYRRAANCRRAAEFQKGNGALSTHRNARA
jgi:hypothetical protein